jgi:uncharacterized protein YndB with AHSA1/START domain
MNVIKTEKDPEALTFTAVVEFDADPERVWQVWADPRKLEKWWGPPTWPATFERHEFEPGGRASYYMTGPEGEKSRGWWEFKAIDEPRSIRLLDGFADENGEPNKSMPEMDMTITFEPIDGGGTRMTSVSRFASVDQLEMVLEMGAEEGMLAAMGQIDDLL